MRLPSRRHRPPTILIAALLAVIGLLGASGAARAASSGAAASTAPLGEGLTGWNLYRNLADLPYLSSGVQSREYTSFDRGGGNWDDGSSQQCLKPGGLGCVIAQDSGAGEITSIWATLCGGLPYCPTGGDVTSVGNIEIVLDGVTILDAPLQDVVDGKLGAPFVYPMVADSFQSSGGVYINVPMTYKSSMVVSVATPSDFYYHVEYQHYPNATGVSTFDPADKASDVLAMFDAAGTQDPIPVPADAQTTSDSAVDVPAGGSVAVAQETGSATISALRIKFSMAVSTATLAGLKLLISFDGRQLVDSPVGEFFGAGLGATDVDSLLFSAGSAVGDWYSAWWPMPFGQSAEVSLQNTTGADVSGVDTEVTVSPDSEWAAALANGGAGYFTAVSHAGNTVDGQDWSFADESGHGKFVGVSQTMQGAAATLRAGAGADGGPGEIGGDSGGGRDYLEGDETAYTDGSLSPQYSGTGTEDFYEAGWYFNYHEFSDPLNGHPSEFKGSDGCPSYCDNAYRLMLTDSIDYDNSLRMGIQHGYTDDVPAVYSSTAFLYTQPTSTLHRTDILDVANAASDSAHAYAGGAATDSSLYSFYEGADNYTGVEGTTRSTSAPVTFTMAVDPANAGVLLRRTSDQAAAYQSAEVSVDGTDVGTWLEPFGNTQERWLSDSFALPSSVTAGQSSITVTLAPTSGAPPWNAESYTADSIVGPFTNTAPPAAPTGLTLVDARDGIRLSWTEPLSATAIASYRIYASSSSSVPIDAAAQIGTSATTGFVQPAVAAGTTRYYAVVAVDTAGNAGPASAALAVTAKPELHTDFTGDGMDDVVTFTQGSPAPVYVALSNGSSFVGNADEWDADFGNGGEVSLTGDFTGNGKDDIVRFTRGTTGDVYVALSNGSSSFGAAQLWDTGFSVNDEIPLVGDFNGDGMDDIATFVPSSGMIYVALSTGHGFAPAERWTFPYQIAPNQISGTGQAEQWNDYIPVVGDFNGDGMDDVAVIDETDHLAYVAESHGTYFHGTSWVWNTGFGNPGEAPAAGDFTGNGIDDLATFTPGHDVYVSLSNGSDEFVQQGWLWNNGFSGGSQIPGVGDFTGNGVSDVVTFARGTDGPVYVSLSNGSSFVQQGWEWNSHFCVNDEWCQPSRLLVSSTSTAP